jgi:hypothetical protein
VGVDCAWTGWGGGDCVASSSSVPVGSIIPATAIDNNSYVFISSDGDDANYYRLEGRPGYYITGSGTFTGAGGNPSWITPFDAYRLDSKIDDGYPNTGNIRSINETVPNVPVGPGVSGTAAAGDCGNTSTSPTSYNITAAFASTPLCALSIDMNVTTH